MEWISVKDETKTPPFGEQLLVSCGYPRFFAKLVKIEIDSNGRKMIWDKQCTSDFDDMQPTHWMIIEDPQKTVNVKDVKIDIQEFKNV